MCNLESSSHNGPVVYIAETRVAMGNRAARDIGNEIRARLRKQPSVRMVFAAAPSQSEMLSALCKESDIEWSRVTAFHMDEYLGLPLTSPQHFGLWLQQTVFDRLPFAAAHLMDPGIDPIQAAAEYAARLKKEPIDIVCCGIGVNGHLAFNDPPADFCDPLTVKIVELDAQCRQQQVDDQCFVTLSEVPTHALTMTVPAMLGAHSIFCTVPGTQKRDAVRRALEGAIDPMCPASALRRHRCCTIYLDRDSAAELCSQSRIAIIGRGSARKT